MLGATGFFTGAEHDLYTLDARHPGTSITNTQTPPDIVTDRTSH